MISHKEFILNILLSILVIYAGINYIYEVRRTHALLEEMSMENSLRENGQGNESDINLEELTSKLCEEEIQAKRDYIDKCMDNFVYKPIQIVFQEILKIGQGKLDECYENRKGLKSKYTNCFPEVSKSPDEENMFRNGSSVNKIKYFVLFIGYARCGGSIVTALLDAHPHVILSHELNAVQKWFISLNKPDKFDKYDLFNDIRNKATKMVKDSTKPPY
ncbi:hypothetical protein LOD99_5686 [Oopsacas minuta]|uniref:Protein-tyrosine sulfotransferase n=1 Tax=Oopsacas minuta TaxID=111878 RepID=A0AAV7JR57_9METZ|nr:hypothetical protein LOD99_5686 [Oopsacas minuta]